MAPHGVYLNTNPDARAVARKLAAMGYGVVDHTRVMICPQLPVVSGTPKLPAGLTWVALDGQPFAQAVGALRGSPDDHISSHALRLAHSPVLYQGFALRRETDGAVLACGQLAAQWGCFRG